VLVCVVVTKVPSQKGGWSVQRRPGSSDSNFRDAALRLGEKITVEGISIEFTGLTTSAATLKISKG